LQLVGANTSSATAAKMHATLRVEVCGLLSESLFMALCIAKIPFVRFEDLIGSAEGVQEGVSEEGQGCSATMSRHENTAESAPQGRRAHLPRSSSSTSIRGVRSSNSSSKIVTMMQTAQPWNG
jgi:hypothetical protein